MKPDYLKYLIKSGASIKDALMSIDVAGTTVSTLFVIDETGKLLGTLTDGDIRRGLIRGISIESPVDEIMNRNYKSITTDDLKSYTSHLEALREKDIRFIPVLENGLIADIVDLEIVYDILPVDAFMLAGGKGERLLPATRELPKPLIVVGDKPIIAHNISRLAKFGIRNIYISINYLGDKIETFLGTGVESGLNIQYVREDRPMGTVGSIILEKNKLGEEILIMNSDLLTNLDFSDFYRSFKQSGADMALAVKPFFQDFPYAVIQTDGDGMVTALKEKPRFTYYSNAGIYLVKKSVLEFIDADFMDATSLIERLIEKGRKVFSYPVLNYWLDIGKPEDLKKAQEDIRHLRM